MRIDIVVDVVCPWCFVGKRRLELALKRQPGIAPRITWRPFQLNPDMPDEGMARSDYLAAKFGGNHQAARIYQAIADAGASVGIPFAFEQIRRTPATRNAHRLVRFAAREGLADALVEALYRAYFIDGRDLGNRGTLTDLAGEVGLDPAKTRRFLAGDQWLADVVEEDRNARRIGINAVPCFIFEGQYALSGAQEPEFFQPIFDLVRVGGDVSA
jgi:predicted DsbA family dithiol-disulfide isomerase